MLPIPQVLRRFLPQHHTPSIPAQQIEPTGDEVLLAQLLADQFTAMSDLAALPDAHVLTPRAMQSELLDVIERTLSLSQSLAHLMECAARGSVGAEQMAALAEASCQLRGSLQHLYTAVFITCDNPDTTS